MKNRREFLQLLFETGAVTAAGLYLPYVPKRIYSFAPPPRAFVVFEGVQLKDFADIVRDDILAACVRVDRLVCIGGEEATGGRR
ncbi:hypothetical protein LCGC14_1401010 [marine sediment metagenome]|uniref:Uncharacterized protein n=1 Tax=marine sediment metagenome TaxID=412755 RepID=A0A0F9MYM2_9ZZZZ